MANNDQAIIIKRIKKGGHGAHGGAWKVAYADFVTAMMAFFLLLWLLSSASEEQKDGIAEYFAPTVGLKDSQGIGTEGGKSPAESEGVSKDSSTAPSIVFGAPSVGEHQLDPSMISDEEAESESKSFEELGKKIEELFENDPELQKFKDNIILEETPEGLKIHVVDQDKLSMFESGKYELLSHTKTILSAIAKVAQSVPNNLSISGHTDASQYRAGATYTNWELSADRANSSRRYLLESGIAVERVKKVVGLADQEPIDKDNPMSPRNRHLSILLLKKTISPYDVAAPASLLQPGDAPKKSEHDKSSHNTGETIPSEPHANTAASGTIDSAEETAKPRPVLNEPFEHKPLLMPTRDELKQEIEDKIKAARPEDAIRKERKEEAHPEPVRKLDDPSQFNVF